MVTGPSPRTSSPGITGWERRLDLDLDDHLGHAVHDVVAGQHAAARVHQIGHGPAVTRPFEHEGREDGDRLGMVQREPPGPPLPRQAGGDVDEEALLLVEAESQETGTAA
jgi:hypothetical protein